MPTAISEFKNTISWLANDSLSDLLGVRLVTVKLV